MPRPGQTPAERREAWIEHQIRQIYEKAPVVPKFDGYERREKPGLPAKFTKAYHYIPFTEEEVELKQTEFEAALAEEKRKAQEAFEKDLAEAVTEAEKEALLTIQAEAEEAKTEFEKQWIEASATAEKEYLKSLAIERRKFQRQYVTTYGRYPSPRILGEIEKREKTAFEAHLAEQKITQKGTFETDLASWILGSETTVKKEISEWAAGQRKISESDLTSWMVGERAIFETELAEIVAPKTITYQELYHAPSPEQVEKIIGLAEQLPRKKAEKYITYVEVEAVEVKEEPKGIAETLGGISITGFLDEWVMDLTGLKGSVREGFKEHLEVVRKMPGQKAVEPVKFVGGVVAPFESVIYGGERLISAYITHHEPITPRPPPAVSGALTSELISHITGGGSVLTGQPTFETKTLQKYGTEYMVGSILGDILLMYAAGYVGSKIWSGAKRIPVVRKVPVTTESLAAWITRPVSTAWRGSRTQMWLIRHSAWYRERALRGITPGLISIPDISKAKAIGMEELIWGKGSWELTMVPRTSGIWVQETIKTVSKVTPAYQHLISRGGALSIGYLRELWFKKPVKPPVAGLLTPEQLGIISLKKKIFRGIPYIPQIVAPMKGATPSIIRYGIAGLILGLKPAPSVKPKIRPKVVTRLKPLTSLLLKQPGITKEITGHIVVPSVALKGVQETRQEVALTPLTRVILGTPTTPVQITPQRHEPPSVASLVLPPMRPKKRRKRRKKKRKPRKKPKWERYGYLYPVATESEAANYVMGKK